MSSINVEQSFVRVIIIARAIIVIQHNLVITLIQLSHTSAVAPQL